MMKNRKVILIVVIIIAIVMIIGLTFIIAKYNKVNKNDNDSNITESMIIKESSEGRDVYRYKEAVVSANNDNIISEIKKVYPNFKEENYEITRTSGNASNVVTGETYIGSEWIDVQLKIGDFYTIAGYTVKAEDGYIKEIYDNNIDIARQEKALMEKDLFKADLYDIHNLKIDENTSSIMYFYDIENDKKYLHVNVKVETGDGEFKSIAYTTEEYELE